MATNPSWHYMPEELIEQILARTPCTKAIVRCTLVCKSWYCLIKSSHFINTHLSGPSTTKYLLCHTSAYRDGEIVDDYSLCSDISRPSRNRVTLVFPHWIKHVKVHGCCNGVICYSKLRENCGSIYFWNPTVRKLRILPRFRQCCRKNVRESIGFWFDAEKSDYEVVKITYTSVGSSVDVYSLRTNSWRIVSDTCPGIPFLLKGDNLAYARGRLHWLVEDGQGWRIFSLNMNNAEFREELISQSLQTDVLYLKRVDANSLVVLRRNGLRRVCVVKVHEQSLELLYTNMEKSFNHQCFLVGFRNNGEALLSLRNDTLFQLPKSTIVSYDFGAKRLTNFVYTCDHLFSAHPFVETLVLLNEGDADVSGWEKTVGILKTLFVKILNCEWLEKL